MGFKETDNRKRLLADGYFAPERIEIAEQIFRRLG